MPARDKKDRKEERRKEANRRHASTNKGVELIAVETLGPEFTKIIKSFNLNPPPVAETTRHIRHMVSKTGTDLEMNDNDPFGDGDQGICGGNNKEGEFQRQILRSLFADCGDLTSHILQKELTPFATACGLGDVATVQKFLKATEFGSEQRMQLLERRETGMRYFPLALTLAVSKGLWIKAISMIHSFPQSQNDYLGVFKLLLKYGARPDAKDLFGKTIVHYGAGCSATKTTLLMTEYCIEAAKSSAHFGKDVVLRNLSKVEYNGLEGKLGGYLADSGRREVILPDGKSLSIQPINIFAKEGDSEKCIYDKDMNLVNVPDRSLTISLQEVFLQQRLDVAEFLTKEHNVDVDIEDCDEISVRKMAYTGYSNPSDVALLIRNYVKQQNKKCDWCKKLSEKLYRCSRCNKTKYCSRECQKNDWMHDHKKVCEVVPPKIVKLMAPTKANNKRYAVKFKQTYQRPNGVEVNEKFILKIESAKLVNNDRYMVKDKSKTCDFFLLRSDPAYKQVMEAVKEQKQFVGLKMYAKASFGDDGKCSVFLNETVDRHW